MTNSHTPTPWHSRGTAGHEMHGQHSIWGEDGKDIAIVYDGEANAACIVRAVNAHEALIQALDDLTYAFAHPIMQGKPQRLCEDQLRAASAALRLARGEAS